jgi:hypothetical protein
MDVQCAAPAGLAIMIWAAVMSWTFGIIWGIVSKFEPLTVLVVCYFIIQVLLIRTLGLGICVLSDEKVWLFIPFACRRIPGCCGRPKEQGKNDTPFTGSSWQSWNEREVRASPGQLAAQGIPTNNNNTPTPPPQHGTYVPPPPPVPPPPASNPYEHGVVGVGSPVIPFTSYFLCSFGLQFVSL